ncbi:MAG: diacylglycerol kinase family protein, partial [Myxococcota bacterium]
VLREALGEVEIRRTEAPRHATALAREALRGGCDLVVALGGDGTFSEVTDGFFDDQAGGEAGGQPIRPEAALGLLPYGTGGDFRRTVGLGGDIAEAARRLRDATPRAIDVGRLRYRAHDGSFAVRHFLNIASFGVGGLVDEIVNASSKALGGKLAFMLGTVRAMLRYKNQPVRLRLDGGEPRDVVINNVAIANGRYFGGGMKIAPDASLDDGLFDVVVLGDLGLTDFLLRGGRVYKGTHLSMPEVTFARARRVEAEALAPGARVLLDVDGEQPGMLPAVFEIVPSALKLKC